MYREMAPKGPLSDCPLIGCCAGRCPRSRRDITEMSVIRAAAAKFIERFGEDASQEACVRADELLGLGDYEGRARWQLINREIVSMLASVNPGAVAWIQNSDGRIRAN